MSRYFAVLAFAVLTASAVGAQPGRIGPPYYLPPPLSNPQGLSGAPFVPPPFVPPITPPRYPGVVGAPHTPAPTPFVPPLGLQSVSIPLNPGAKLPPLDVLFPAEPRRMPTPVPPGPVVPVGAK